MITNSSSHQGKNATYNFSNSTPSNNLEDGVLCTRDAKYVYNGGLLYRVKNPLHSSAVAHLEVFMGTLFKLLGLGAPNLLCVSHCNDFLNINKNTRLDFEKLNSRPENAYCVASEVVESFQDLSTFLLDKRALNFIKESNKKKYEELRTNVLEKKQLLNDIRPKHSTHNYLRKNDGFKKIIAARKVKRLNKQIFLGLTKTNDFLIDELKNDQLLHYYASLFICNWDFLNCGLCNFGYYYDDQGNPKGMTVDFGLSGPLGFRGKSKNESYDRALKTSRPENPLDTVFFFLKDNSVFNGQVGETMTTISSIPRCEPIIPIIKKELGLQYHLWDSEKKTTSEQALNIAYRLMVIPNKIFEELVTSHYILETEGFEYRASFGHDFGAKEMLRILLERKRAFISKYGVDNIKKWEKNHPLVASEIRCQINKELERLSLSSENILPLTIQEIDSAFLKLA